MSKPREFWIKEHCRGVLPQNRHYSCLDPDGMRYVWSNGDEYYPIHVIEYSAYQRVVERLKMALAAEYSERTFESSASIEEQEEYVAQELEKLEREKTFQEQHEKLQRDIARFTTKLAQLPDTVELKQQMADLAKLIQQKVDKK